MYANTDILIVGAGPTGLMAACQLSRFGIDFIVIDPKPGTTEQSRALAVQARTLELYDQLGLADTAVEEGQKANAVNIYVKGKKAQRMVLGDIGKGKSKYPYMHILEQSKNEAILEDFLKNKGAAVEWSSELISVQQDSKGIVAVVKTADGQEKIIHAKWLIGADGARSFVRQHLEIPFEGDTYGQVFFVLDAKVEWELAYDELFVSLSEHSFHAFFPMKGDKRMRIVGTLPKHLEGKDTINFEDLKGAIDSQLEIAALLSEPRWHSVYKLHHRCVSAFQKERMFLAGDAAHIHSPAGGQGMNTGLQDAYNLSWKLALVVKGLVTPAILETYNQERLPVAQTLVSSTDKAFSMMVSDNPVLLFLRSNMLPQIAKWLMPLPFFSQKAFGTISQININYRDSPLSVNISPENLTKSKVKAGDRVPYLPLTGMGKGIDTIQDFLKNEYFNLFLFDVDGFGHALPEFQLLDSNFKALVKTHFINYEDNRKVYEFFGVEGAASFLARPDMYFCFTDSNISAAALNAYMKKLCGNFPWLG